MDYKYLNEEGLNYEKHLYEAQIKMLQKHVKEIEKELKKRSK